MIHREFGGGEGVAAVARGGGDQHDRLAGERRARAGGVLLDD